ncbi:MAG: glycosyltransferase [Balneolaceae bacterium]|nr:glycosyltransferase [Balneolaceae bacterium]
MSYDLAIVVPAYKPDFLKEALESLYNQTDRRFSLYIFDDASPHDLRKISDSVKLSDNTRFHKFEENVGGISLVKHWNRCIRLTNNEPWIWLFSDDDLADPECVKSFYETRKKYPDHSAYRFNTRKISANGETIKENVFPETFDAADFLNLKLSYSQESYVVETIFSREIYHQIGGIPDLPLAWAADDLFNIQIAFFQKIRTINGPRVSWRYSDKNISGKNSRESAITKLEASRTFVNYIISNKKIAQKLEPEDLPLRWYIRQIKGMLPELSLKDQFLAVWKMGRKDRRVWKHFVTMKKEKSRSYQWLKRFLS